MAENKTKKLLSKIKNNDYNIVPNLNLQMQFLQIITTKHCISKHFNKINRNIPKNCKKYILLKNIYKYVRDSESLQKENSIAGETGNENKNDVQLI